MSIAIIGWGSLIWCPGSLLMSTRWKPRGPKLPVEFRRVSADRRLTLVIDPKVAASPTWWVRSEFSDARRAVENLRTREGHRTVRIGLCTLKDALMIEGDKNRPPASEPEKDAVERIASWMKRRPRIKGVIWTALDAKGDVHDGVSAIKHLNQLKDVDESALQRAREYIECAPKEIDTPIRQAVLAEFEWSVKRLSRTLFER